MSIQQCSFLLLILLPLAVTTTTSAAAAAGIPSCSKDDAATLLQIKLALGSPPSLSTWNASVTDCCPKWAGVGCDSQTGRVNFLRIAFDSNIHGPIPPTISNLTHLSTLQIFSNPHLSGPIPTSLCQLQKLTNLDLSLNNLTGRIPGCFPKSLNFVDFSMNRLSGHIPDNFMLGATETVMSTPWLNLQQNQLTGPIPRSLGDVPLKGIELSNNRLTGGLSFLSGANMKRGSLQSLEVSGNKLQFDMSKVYFPPTLQRLMLDGNAIHGSIPRQIVQLRNLNFFNVSNNHLCGPIPTSKVIKKFDASSFDHNKCLCGPPLQQPCH